MSTITPLKYMVNHVFLPPKLPLQDDANLKFDADLCAELIGAATEFAKYLQGFAKQKWAPIIQMLKNVQDTIEMTGDSLSRTISSMDVGGASHAPHLCQP